MTPYALIVDDFFPEFAAARSLALEQSFATVRNPYDRKDYPTVAVIPEDTILSHPFPQMVHGRIAAVMSSRIAVLRMLFRLSLLRDAHPYQAHSDAFMHAQYTAVIYLNKPFQVRGGLSILSHHAMGTTHWNASTLADHHRALRADSDNPKAWDVDLFIPMRSNRLVIIPADLIHRSEPTEGFGLDKDTGRLVMIVSFSLQP